MAVKYTYRGEEGEFIPRDATHVFVKAEVVPARAFYQHPNIEEVICSEDVEKIEQEAFYKCPRLRKAVMPGVRDVETCAFQLCGNLTTLGNLPSVELVEAHAFANCKSVEGCISLPNATQIGTYAFVCCGKVTSLFAPKATKIGRGAFSGCMNIDPTKVTCPYDSIDKNTFETDALFREVQTHLRAEESQRYTKIFKMYLTNLHEFTLTVESYNVYSFDSLFEYDLVGKVAKLLNNSSCSVFLSFRTALAV